MHVLSQPPAQAAPTQQQPRYELTDEDKKRQKCIARAWQAYDGELDAPLQRMQGQADDNVLTNRMQAVVDRGVDFLFGKEIDISVEEGAPKEAQALLDTTWGRKEARVPLLQKLAMSGALSRNAFLRIVPGPMGGFRLVVVDPSTVCVQTAPQDCETVLLYCIEYTSHEKRGGKLQAVSYREEIIRLDPTQDDDTLEDTDADGLDSDVTWQIQHWSRVGERGTWIPAGAPIAWNYSFPPLFSCQNLPRPNDFWGMADITHDLIGINDALNLVQSNINRINKLYGHPILYATGTGEQVFDIQPGRIIGLPLSESKIVAVTLASDVANALTFADNLRSDIDEQSGVPGIATGRIREMPRGNVSGIALELLFMPLLKKTDKKRCLYGELLIDVSKALLVLAGMSGDIDITLNWQSPLPHDDLQSAQTALVLKQLGISDDTLQRELGYDPDEEALRSQEEAAQPLTNSGVPLPVPPVAAAAAQPAPSPFIGRAGG